MDNNIRVEEHKKNIELELLLKKLSKNLSGLDFGYNNIPTKPTVFIVGCARSGTTLLSQLLAKSSLFSYPTNLISRFFYNVHLGCMIQKILSDLDNNSELLKYYDNSIDFASKLGKTKGPLAPNEFWYFWRKHLPFDTKFSKVREEELCQQAIIDFNKGISAFHDLFQKPLMLKGMICNWDIPLLSTIVPNAFFIHVERDIRYNAQSLIESRKKFFGNINEWYSFKPLEYDKLVEHDPFYQVVGQVHYTNKAIQEGLNELDVNRYLHIKYEDLCNDPKNWIDKVASLIAEETLLPNSTTAEAFIASDKILLDKSEWSKIEKYSKQMGYE